MISRKVCKYAEINLEKSGELIFGGFSSFETAVPQPQTTSVWTVEAAVVKSRVYLTAQFKQHRPPTRTKRPTPPACSSA